MSNDLHRNENYLVCVHYGDYVTPEKTYPSCYQVANIHTGVVELYTNSLPHAIHEAEGLNVAMVNKTWEWMTKTEKEEEPKEYVHPGVLQ